MQAEFRNRLSADLTALVDQTEQSAGIEINVVVSPERGSGPLKCELDEDGAQIIIGDVAYFPDPSVFHELQHIRRVLLEGVPRLAACEQFELWSPELDTAVAQLDNNIEHLVIVPREFVAYPARRAYWEARIQRHLDRLLGGEFPSIERERFAMLALVLVDHLTPRLSLQDSVRRFLQELRIEERAGQYRDAMLAALASKEQMVRITFEYFALPVGAGCLEFWIAESRSFRVKHLSELDVAR